MFTRSVVLRRALSAAAAITAAFALSACGGTDSASSGSGTDHGSTLPASSAPAATFNDADVMFAQMMIEHHRQAIAMAALADTRATNADVKSLAVKIKAAQQPEIDTMNEWLTTWGEPAPEPSTSGDMKMGQTSHGPMPGAMSDADMSTLMDSKGAAFDKQFLTMMITHHQGAITMAKQETAQGTNADAKALAAKIVTDQQAEITTMQQMLTTM